MTEIIEKVDIYSTNTEILLESRCFDYCSLALDSEVVDVFRCNVQNSDPTYKTFWNIDFSSPADSWILGEDSKDSEDSSTTCALGATAPYNGEIIESPGNSPNFEFSKMKISQKRSHVEESEDVESEHLKLKKWMKFDFEPIPKLHIHDTLNFKNFAKIDTKFEDSESNFMDQKEIMMDFELENPMDDYGGSDGLVYNLSPVYET